MAPANPTVAFTDLSWQFKQTRRQLHESLDEVGNSGQFILGSNLSQFEVQMRTRTGSDHIIGVGNGSDAVVLLLRALNIGPGDEVITAPNSFIATMWAIRAVGATPVFADIGLDLNIDPDEIETKITVRTKAIVVVHLAGIPARMTEIRRVAAQAGVPIIEDAAQAIGAHFGDEPVGSLGKAAAFSLHPLKNLAVLGDGGFISTNSQTLSDRLRILRNHGLVDRDHALEWGLNSRLDELQASFALVRERKFDEWMAHQNSIAGRYSQELSDTVKLPQVAPDVRPAFHNFMLLTPKRDELRVFLQENSIETRVHYPIPLHLQPCAKELGHVLGDFPAAEEHSQQAVSLPLHPGMNMKSVDYVITKVRDFFHRT